MKSSPAKQYRSIVLGFMFVILLGPLVGLIPFSIGQPIFMTLSWGLVWLVGSLWTFLRARHHVQGSDYISLNIRYTPIVIMLAGFAMTAYAVIRLFGF